MDRSGAAEVESMIQAEFDRADKADKAAKAAKAEEADRSEEADNAKDAKDADQTRRVILVDGFNVLHAVLLGKEREEGWWGRESRERLLRRVSVWPGGPDEIWVAFDGTQPAWSVWAEPISVPKATGSMRSTVHSVFVESADDWIVRRARRASNPAQTIIVSGDRKVTGRARSAGCEIWTPWTLISRCPRPDEAVS